MAKVKDLFDEATANPVCSNLLHLEMIRKQKANLPKGKNPALKKYYELVQVTDEVGYREEIVEVDYPITPDYVKSFENSASYKTDVVSAIANGVKSSNIGDVTKIQELSAKDTAEVQSLMIRLGEIFNKKEPTTTAEPTTAAEVGE